jgi:RNA polymerase sigma-70 factor (ECF subfamily)
MTDVGVKPDDAVSTITSSLLEGVRTRDDAAWGRLVHLYSPLVYKWCRQKGLRAEDAENVGQEIFLAVDRGLAKFSRNGDGHTFRGWLRRITQNKIVDFFRRGAKQPEGRGGAEAQQRLVNLASKTQSEEDDTDLAEETTILYRRVVEWVRSEFEETTWQAFHRVVVEGQAPADVAADLQISKNAVYLAKSRILRRVREQFNQASGPKPP